MSAADESKAGLGTERKSDEPSGPQPEQAVEKQHEGHWFDAGAKGRAVTAAAVEEIARRRAAGERSRYQMFLAGELGTSDMDDDELSRGQFRNLGGTFQGSNIQKYSAKTHADMKRELLKRGQSSLDGAYLKAISVLSEIADSGLAEDRDRIKAALAIMERVAGKVPDRIEVGGTDAFSDVLQGIIDDSVREDKPAAFEGEVLSEHTQP